MPLGVSDQKKKKLIGNVILALGKYTQRQTDRQKTASTG